MGCGCSKNRASVGERSARSGAPAVRKQNVVIHEVLNDNEEVIASFTNPVSARAEARRIGGVVRSTTSPTKTPTTRVEITSTDNAK